MSQLHDVLRAEMSEAQIWQQEYYNQHRKPNPNLKSGDRVWFLPRKVRTTRPCKKLDYEKIGLFRILAKIGSSAYKLNLPPTMGIHNTIHISLLEPYKENRLPSKRQESPPPIILEGEPEYELDDTIDFGLYYGKLKYRAKWTGYSPELDKVWYPASNFWNAVYTRHLFHEWYPRKPHKDQDWRTAQSRNLGTGLTTTNTVATNQPWWLSIGPTPVSRVCLYGHEQDGMLRRHMLDTHEGQGSNIFPDSATKAMSCRSLRRATTVRNPATKRRKWMGLSHKDLSLWERKEMGIAARARQGRERSKKMRMTDHKELKKHVKILTKDKDNNCDRIREL